MQLLIKNTIVTVSLGEVARRTYKAKILDYYLNSPQNFMEKIYVCAVAFLAYYGYLEHCSHTQSEPWLTRDDFLDWMDNLQTQQDYKQATDLVFAFANLEAGEDTSELQATANTFVKFMPHTIE